MRIYRGTANWEDISINGLQLNKFDAQMFYGNLNDENHYYITLPKMSACNITTCELWRPLHP